MSPTPVTESTLPMIQLDAKTHIAYVAQQHLDGYAEAVANVLHQKKAFDKNMYKCAIDYTFKTERKLLPKWSQPHRVTARNLNSYKLETLQGVAVLGDFSARKLRRFEPREGMALVQKESARAAGGMEGG
ncbi:hypothetical protein H0H92_000314 [Tricholoma furcatifolium]|nr:hypothetical protein H0H92_000314 [Tricholoma furcatifolium]